MLSLSSEIWQTQQQLHFRQLSMWHALFVMQCLHSSQLSCRLAGLDHPPVNDLGAVKCRRKVQQAYSDVFIV